MQDCWQLTETTYIYYWTGLYRTPQKNTNPMDTRLVFWNTNLKNNQKNKFWHYWYCLSIIMPVLHDANS